MLQPRLRIRRDPGHSDTPQALVALAAMFTLATACGPLRFDELPDGGDASVWADATSTRDADQPGMDAAADAGMAGGDAADIDASDDITVVVDVGGLRFGGLPILLHDRESRFIAIFLTAADGTATIPFVQDGFVSLVFGAETDFAYISTLQLWAPGAIVAFDFSGADRTRPVGNARVSPLQPFGDATTYSVSFGCTETDSSTSGPAREVELKSSCIGSSNVARALATAQSRTGQLVAYEWSMPFVPTTTATAEVRFDGHWLPASTSCQLEGTSVPSGATRVDFSCDPVVDGVVYALPRATASVESGRSIELEVAGTNESRFRATTTVRYGSALEDSTSLLAEHLPSRATSSTSLARNLTTSVLPRVASAAMVRTGGPRLVWTLDRPLAFGEADAIVAVVGSEQATWNIMLPATAESPFRMPELPEILMKYAPSREEASLHVLDADEFAGYDDLAERYGMVGLLTGYLSVPPLTRARSSGFGGLSYDF